MKNTQSKKMKRRLPLEAVLRLQSHPVTSKKGEKGYDRKKVKELNRKIPREDIFEENH